MNNIYDDFFNKQLGGKPKRTKNAISVKQAKKKFIDYYKNDPETNKPTEEGKLRAMRFDMMYQKKPKYTWKCNTTDVYDHINNIEPNMCEEGSAIYLKKHGPKTFDLEGIDSFNEDEIHNVHSYPNEIFRSRGSTYRKDIDTNDQIYGPRLKKKSKKSQKKSEEDIEKYDLEGNINTLFTKHSKNWYDYHYDKNLYTDIIKQNSPNYKPKKKSANLVDIRWCKKYPEKCNENEDDDSDISTISDISTPSSSVIIDGETSEELEESHTIDEEESHTIDGIESHTIDGEESHTIDEEESHTIDGIESHTIDGEESHTIDGEESHTIDGEESHTIDGEESHTIDGIESHTIDGEESHTIDGIESHTIDGIESHTIDGIESHTIDGEESHTIDGEESIMQSDIDESRIEIGESSIDSLEDKKPIDWDKSVKQSSSEKSNIKKYTLEEFKMLINNKVKSILIHNELQYFTIINNKIYFILMIEDNNVFIEMKFNSLDEMLEEYDLHSKNILEDDFASDIDPSSQVSDIDEYIPDVQRESVEDIDSDKISVEISDPQLPITDEQPDILLQDQLEEKLPETDISIDPEKIDPQSPITDPEGDITLQEQSEEKLPETDISIDAEKIDPQLPITDPEGDIILQEQIEEKLPETEISLDKEKIDPQSSKSDEQDDITLDKESEKKLSKSLSELLEDDSSDDEEVETELKEFDGKVYYIYNDDIYYLNDNTSPMYQEKVGLWTDKGPIIDEEYKDLIFK